MFQPKLGICDEDDVQSWVLNHLPLNSRQKWDLVQALKLEKQLAQDDLKLTEASKTSEFEYGDLCHNNCPSHHPKFLEEESEKSKAFFIEPDMVPSSESIDCKTPVPGELDPCLNDLEKLQIQDQK